MKKKTFLHCQTEEFLYEKETYETPQVKVYLLEVEGVLCCSLPEKPGDLDFGDGGSYDRWNSGF